MPIPYADYRARYCANGYAMTDAEFLAVYDAWIAERIKVFDAFAKANREQVLGIDDQGRPLPGRITDDAILLSTARRLVAESDKQFDAINDKLYQTVGVSLAHAIISGMVYPTDRPFLPPGMA